MNFTSLSKENMKNTEHQTFKPLLKWAGGKEKELENIRTGMPDGINRFVEPFVGGGSVFLNLGTKNVYINDKSIELIDLYKLVQAQNEDFFRVLKSICNSWSGISEFSDSHHVELKNLYEEKISIGSFLQQHYFTLKKLLDEKLGVLEKDFFYQLERNLKSKIERTKKIAFQKKMISDTDIFLNMECALKSAFYMTLRNLYNFPENIDKKTFSAIFYFIREFCYASMFRYNTAGKFNVPYGGISYNRKDFFAKINYLQSEGLHEKLLNTRIANLDFEEFLNSLSLTEDDFIFLDPPYDSDFSTYGKNLFGKSEQIRLANALRKTKAKFLLVIKNTDFIHELYKDFYISSFEKKYLVSFKNRNNKTATHLVITNYPRKYEK